MKNGKWLFNRWFLILMSETVSLLYFNGMSYSSGKIISRLHTTYPIEFDLGSRATFQELWELNTVCPDLRLPSNRYICCIVCTSWSIVYYKVLGTVGQDSLIDSSATELSLFLNSMCIFNQKFTYWLAHIICLPIQLVTRGN